MNKIKGILFRFFYGRYGSDSFGSFLLVLYVILCVLNAIFISDVVSVLVLILMGYIIWRMMSRNHLKRRRENEIFLKVWSPVKINIKLFFDRIRYVRSSRFRKCKHCKAIIKLPVKRGKHNVRCPKCGEIFQVRIVI